MTETVRHRIVRPSARSLRTEILIRDVASALGLKAEGNAFQCWHPECHKHGDRTPSVRVNLKSNKLHCFGCELNHSTIDLVADVLHLPISEAIKWLAEQFPAAAGEWTTEVEANQRTRWIDPKQPKKGTKKGWQWNVGQYGKGKHSKRDRIMQIILSSQWPQLTAIEAKVLLTLMGRLLPYGNPVIEITTLKVAKASGLKYKVTAKALKGLDNRGLLEKEVLVSKGTIRLRLGVPTGSNHKRRQP